MNQRLSITKNLLPPLNIVLFAFFTLWWVAINFSFLGQDEGSRQLFSTFYAVQALFGGIMGLLVARKWGGNTSYFGRALSFLSYGLLLQVFGQLVYSYYNVVLKVFIPYPSLGDLGYFGSIPCYIYGGYQLARALGAHLSLKSATNKLWAVLVPLLMLGFSYIELLKGYEFDGDKPLLATFLDFAYPLSQAVYISVALLVFVFSFKMLGGLLRKRVLLLLFAFLVQYVADFTFIYQNAHGLWEIAGVGEYFYYLAYFIMSLALLGLGSSFDNLKNSES